MTALSTLLSTLLTPNIAKLIKTSNLSIIIIQFFLLAFNIPRATFSRFPATNYHNFLTVSEVAPWGVKEGYVNRVRKIFYKHHTRTSNSCDVIEYCGIICYQYISRSIMMKVLKAQHTGLLITKQTIALHLGGNVSSDSGEKQENGRMEV